MRGRWAVNTRVKSPSHMLKRSLISLATFSYASKTVTPNLEARKTFNGFQKVLRIVLPKTLGFKKMRVQPPDVIFETDTGDFSFDAVSGGIAALIDIAWQVFLYSTLVDEFVVAIDEPETHLHPALQRSILPNLLEAFPKAQFVVATHNPLVIGSTKNSSVYVLAYDKDGRVNSQLLDQINKAGTANEILREVLGIEASSAPWVDDAVQTLIEKVNSQPLTSESLEDLRAGLNKLGLSRHLPSVIDEIRR